jgi:hypothetical protein
MLIKVRQTIPLTISFFYQSRSQSSVLLTSPDLEYLLNQPLSIFLWQMIRLLEGRTQQSVTKIVSYCKMPAKTTKKWLQNLISTLLGWGLAKEQLLVVWWQRHEIGAHTKHQKTKCQKTKRQKTKRRKTKRGISKRWQLQNVDTTSRWITNHQLYKNAP